MDKAEEWAAEQWGYADLGDERRTQRAVMLGTALTVNPAGGLPKQADQWGHLKAAYRLLNNDAVSHEVLQESHWAQVRQLALAQDRVLFIQDTTELAYQQVWTRQECAFKPAESRTERARRENKESEVWAKI